MVIEPGASGGWFFVFESRMIWWREQGLSMISNTGWSGALF